MKLEKVRVGERFVFDHTGGVWMKATAEKARCIYGKNYGKEEPILPDMSVYVIFEDRSRMRRKPPETPECQSVSTEDTSSKSHVGATTVVEASAVPQNGLPSAGATEVPVPPPEPPKEPVAPPAPMPEPALGVGVCNIPYPTTGKMRMLLVDEDEKVIVEVPDATAAQVAAYSHAEGVKLNDKLGRQILETFVDHVTQTLYVVLGRDI